MKSIEERVTIYSKNLIDTEYDRGSVIEAFIEGVKSEHYELTKWNSPEELPNHENLVLGKSKAGGYKLMIKDSDLNVFIDLKTYLVIWPTELIGWREIHE